MLLEGRGAMLDGQESSRGRRRLGSLPSHFLPDLGPCNGRVPPLLLPKSPT